MTTHATRGYAKGRAKREEILDAATELFAEVGYNGASLREIAARCSITHPGLIHHFPTKAALLAAVLERRDSTDSEDVGLELGGGGEMLARLTRLVALNTTRRNLVEMYTALAAEATSPSHPAHQFFIERYAMIRGALIDVIHEAQRTGEVRADIDAATAAAALIALMDGLQLQWLLQPDTVDMAAIFDAAMSAMLGSEPHGRSEPEMPGPGT